ncbi:unnamed protein product [Rotaria sp. Silwood1]|nr:unnamed protein product [Rotaria sp. Silwood1]CAF1672140.1 unnamed protein product [Rotaria sp. Silwood1]
MKTPNFNTVSTQICAASQQITVSSNKHKRDVLSQEVPNTNPIMANSTYQQYCAEIQLQLWQSCLDIALQPHIWPEQVYAIAKTNNFNIGREYVMNSIHNIKQQLIQCQLELSKQSKLCPITMLPLDQIDHSLEKMVGYERKYLSIRNHHQLLQFKEKIYEKQLGPSCIRFTQSAIRPRKQQEIEIKNEHTDISTKRYFTPVSYKDQIQALQQIQTVTLIRQKIKKHNLIIRLTDKGNNFYIGSTVEFQQEAQKFFSDTSAFKELSSNPFNEILDKVVQLLNELASKKLISNGNLKNDS